MLRYVDWSRAYTLVELGGGTGVMTRAIQEKKSPEAYLTSCEIDANTFEKLRRYEDSTTRIILSDAEKCLEQYDHGGVDTIISTLPLGSIKPEHARDILAQAAKVLTQDGVYIQYQYFATNKSDIEAFFTIEKVDWEPLNFPPAFIYICKKK